MEGLNNGRRPNEAAPIGNEEDVFRHPSLGNARINDQLVASERFSDRIFEIADRGGVGIASDVAKTRLSNGRTTEATAANGFADQDDSARTRRAQDEGLINGNDQRLAGSRGHGVVEVDVRGGTRADERPLNRQVISTGGIRGDIDSGIAGTEQGGSEMEISKDFVAVSDTAVIGDEVPEIHWRRIGDRSCSESHCSEFHDVFHSFLIAMDVEDSHQRHP